MGVKTIVTEQYEPQTLEFYNTLFENVTKFKIYGQTPERSYEDRSVYFDFTKCGGTGWLDGEQAIELGQALIKHGTNALLANMYQHQLIHRKTRLKTLIAEGYVDKLVFTMIDDKPKNHGGGFCTFNIKPVWKVIPEYESEFEFEQIIYFSPFEDEFKKQCESYGLSIEFVNWSFDENKKRFDEFSKQFY